MSLGADTTGVFVITPTPFYDDGGLALDDIPRMVTFFLEREVQGLTILGMMGEAAKPTEPESLQVVRAVLRAAGTHVPVVVGVPTGNFATMHHLALGAMEAGAVGVMVAPSANLRGDDAILRHFQTAVETLGPIPLVLQDYPQGTGVRLPPTLIRRIIDTTPTCVMLKHEDWPGLAKLSWLRDQSATQGMRRIPILTGNGALFLPDELRRGADGAMTGFAFPEMMRDVIRAHRAGDPQGAADLFDAYLPLVRYEQQAGLGLAVRKHILVRRGAIRSAAQRQPASRLDPDDIDDINFMLARLDRRLAGMGRNL